MQLSPSMPIPPDAVDAGDWGEDGARPFRVLNRRVGDAELTVWGFQHYDGRTHRFISIFEAHELTAADARAFAAVLLDAANRIESHQ